MTVLTNTTMRLEHFHDFYYLEAIKAGMTTELALRPDMKFSHTVDKLREDIEDACETIIPNMALRTFVYMYAVCYGEARHARSDNAKERFVPSTRTLHRTECYGDVMQYAPTKENINVLVNVFSQPWKAGFGGDAWRSIAEALHYYFKVSPEAFIDHVIDLEHNGGTVFNKGDAKKVVYFDTHYPSEHLKDFLNWKFSRDILTRPPQHTPEIRVTRKVFNLVRRFTNIFGKQQVYWLSPELKSLGSYEVAWGDKSFDIEAKWYEWVDVSSKNKPTGEMLYLLAKVDAIYPAKYTEKQLTKLVKTKRNEVVKKAGKHMTKVLLKNLDERIAQWLQWALPKARIAKKAITYSVMPCKVNSEQYGKVKLQFALPYQGYGTKEEYGFSLTCATVMQKLEGDTPGYDGKGKWSDGYLTNQIGSIVLSVYGQKYMLQNSKLEAFINS